MLSREAVERHVAAMRHEEVRRLLAEAIYRIDGEASQAAGWLRDAGLAARFAGPAPLLLSDVEKWPRRVDWGVIETNMAFSRWPSLVGFVSLAVGSGGRDVLAIVSFVPDESRGEDDPRVVTKMLLTLRGEESDEDAERRVRWSATLPLTEDEARAVLRDDPQRLCEKYHDLFAALEAGAASLRAVDAGAT